ncbi:MAG: AMP-binding protein [Fimbriimonadaceae bacterium]
MPAQLAERLQSWLEVANHLRGHFFVLTSGTTARSEGDYKWVALSKQSVLAAARAANVHLQEAGATGNASAGGPPTRPNRGLTHATPQTQVGKPPTANHDIWLHCLPDFHVGGLGIWARAHLSGAKVVRLLGDRWDPTEFTTSAEQERATLCSLVPTQVFDLLTAGLTAPPSIRAVVVGGGALPAEDYLKARALGWPVLPSYGMTEAASQVATASLASLLHDSYPALQVLRHLEVKIDAETALILLRGSSLLSGIVATNTSGSPVFQDPKDGDGWLKTDDFGEIASGGLRVLGRKQDRIKVGGELVNIAALRAILHEHAARVGLARQVALLALPDLRLESVIVLVAESGAVGKVEALAEAFDACVMPFERIRQIRQVTKIPRTALGKVKWSELSALAQAQ